MSDQVDRTSEMVDNLRAALEAHIRNHGCLAETAMTLGAGGE